jgi:hypothetical protein
MGRSRCLDASGNGQLTGARAFIYASLRVALQPGALLAIRETLTELHSMSRLFISYGRADAEDLALRLADDLTHAGHDVWFDRKEIKPGRAWEAEIETSDWIIDSWRWNGEC